MIHLIFSLFSMIIRHKHFTHHICIPIIPVFIWRQGSLHSTHPLQQHYIHNVWPWKRWKWSWKGWCQCHHKTLCDNIQGQFDTNQCCCCDSHPLQVSQNPLFIVVFTVVVSSVFMVLSMRRPVVAWRSFRGMWVPPLSLFYSVISHHHRSIVTLSHALSTSCSRLSVTPTHTLSIHSRKPSHLLMLSTHRNDQYVCSIARSYIFNCLHLFPGVSMHNLVCITLEYILYHILYQSLPCYLGSCFKYE